MALKIHSISKSFFFSDIEPVLVGEPMKLMFIQNNSISNVMSLDATKLTSVIGMISHKMSLITIFGHTSILEKNFIKNLTFQKFLQPSILVYIWNIFRNLNQNCIKNYIRKWVLNKMAVVIKKMLLLKYFKILYILFLF